MVQILPPKTNVGTQIGQALGAGLAEGSNIGFQRGLIQNALKGLENVPKGTTPFQLASKLLQATAGIPGAERYVGQLFPHLLTSLQSQAAFGNQPGQPSEQQAASFGGQFAQGVPGTYGATAQELTPSAQQEVGGAPGGILGSVIPQDQINQQAQQYAQQTGTGLEGATRMQQYLLGKNQIALQQRAQAEQKASDLGVPADEIPAFMQLGQKHQNAKTFDDWARSTNRDYREYKNLSKSLDSVIYPGITRGVLFGPSVRESRLKEIDNTVKRLVNLGFEPEVRSKLSESGLSPAEVEERIHPFSRETKIELQKLPHQGPAFQSEESLSKKEEKLKDFMQKNVTNDTSLLALRNRLWQDKGYDWKRIAKVMNEAIDPSRLTAAQTNELGILEREPPRQSLQRIFRDWGSFLQAAKGQR